MTSAVPYLTVDNGTTALEFYAAAFGAEVVERFDDHGRLAHATVRIGTATIFVSDEYPGLGSIAPRTLGGSTSAVVLGVEDADAAYARAIAAGSAADRPVETDGSGARSGWLTDPFGHRWNLRTEERPSEYGE